MCLLFTYFGMQLFQAGHRTRWQLSPLASVYESYGPAVYRQTLSTSQLAWSEAHS